MPRPLPNELILLIVSFLEDTTYSKSRQNYGTCCLCLVSRVFFAAAQPLLWRSVKLFEDKPPTRSKRAWRTAQAASMKSVVRQLVKVERIGLYDCPSIDEDYLAAMNGLQDVKRLSFDDTDISLPPSALDSSTFSRLTFLSLDCVTLTIETAAALLQVCTLPNLKALALAELREPAEEAEADDVVMFLPHLPDDFLAQLDVLQLALCDADFIPRDWIFSSTPVLVTVQSWDAHSEDQEARLIDSLLSAMPQHLSLQGVWSPFDCLSSWDGEQVERANDLFAQLVAYIENGPAVETLCSHPLSNRPLPSLTISPTAVATFFEPVRRHEAWEWGKALKEKEANKS